MRKVCVVTGSRAEYGLLYPVMKRIEASSALALQLVVTTMHMSDAFGATRELIEQDGFTIADCVENLLACNSRSAVAKSAGMAMVLLSDSFRRLAPDVVLLLGDRFETHAAATTALLMNIPIAHIHGGERTEGAVDEQIRHAITKMSHLHFTATEEYRRRIIQMGELAERVFCCGAPGIDNLMQMEPVEKPELEQDLGWLFGVSSALCTYHPETLSESSVRWDMERILRAIDASGLRVLFTYANADCGGALINEMIEAFCARNPARFKVVASLGQRRYLSAMRYVDLLIGNSSSAIIEAASLHKPVVNIGDRQKGRLQSGNVVNCLPRGVEDAIVDALVMRGMTFENRYGCGDVSEQIVSVLERVPLSVTKKFVDVERADAQ